MLITCVKLNHVLSSINYNTVYYMKKILTCSILWGGDDQPERPKEHECRYGYRVQVGEAVEQLAGGEEEHPHPRPDAGEAPLGLPWNILQVKETNLIFTLQPILVCVGGGYMLEGSF